MNHRPALLQNARLKLFAARAALDEQPKLIEQAVDQINLAAQVRVII